MLCFVDIVCAQRSFLAKTFSSDRISEYYVHVFLIKIEMK